MDAFSLRLASDRDHLQRLGARSSGKIDVLQVPSEIRPRAEIELRYRTADARSYPSTHRNSTRLVIDFAARYPFIAPVARITTPILHPNVWESGVVCLGAKWIASEGIDLFVHRIARLLSFDALLVNEQSAANRNALAWYQQTRRQHPTAFPSDQVKWQEEAAQPDIGKTKHVGDTSNLTSVLACPSCSAKLRLPTGRSGVVACPKCRHEFNART
jgi:hypothetical protein